MPLKYEIFQQRIPLMPVQEMEELYRLLEVQQLLKVTILLILSRRI